MNHKLVNCNQAGRALCPVRATLYFQSHQLKQVRLESSKSFQLHIQGLCPDEGAVINWFECFLSGTHPPFPLPLSFNRDCFSGKVLEALSTIPFGKLKTYGEIAAQLNNPQGARAVGNACNRNPYPLIFPCHRIVSSSGKSGGFAYGMPMKQDLLEFEKQTIQKHLLHL